MLLKWFQNLLKRLNRDHSIVNKIELEILGLSSSQSQTGSFALVLGEAGGKRRLPIIIGMFEAQAIAIEIEKIAPNRPMTHDLFKTFSESFNYTIQEIVISDLKEGVFFAQIICSDGVKTVEIDSRPSDAIAIGLRFGAPIYTFESIMSEAGIVLSESEEEELGHADDDESDDAQEPVEIAASSDSKELPFNEMSMEQLNAMLNDALSEEDYEQAAKIRDELNKRN